MSLRGLQPPGGPVRREDAAKDGIRQVRSTPYIVAPRRGVAPRCGRRTAMWVFGVVLVLLILSMFIWPDPPDAPRPW